MKKFDIYIELNKKKLKLN